MNTTLLIAGDSVRALLRQKLLLGLMVAALALIAIFSAFLISQRKMATYSAVASSEANDSADTRGAPPADKAGPVGPKPRAHRDVKSLSKKEQQQLTQSLDQMSSAFQAFFYQAASFGGSMVSLFIFSIAVSAELRRGTIKITLTKPVSRTQFILGKYLGGVAVMAGYAAIASAAIILFAKFGHLTVTPAMKFAPWLMFCRQLMLGALALTLSLFVHPFVAAVLAFFAGNGFYGNSNPLFYVLPSYDAFNLFGAMLQGSLVSQREVALLSVYALDFIALMLILALWRFRTKELV